MDFIPVEMFFDPRYSDQMVGELSDRLVGPLEERLAERFNVLQRQLEFRPCEKHAGQIECGSFDFDGMPEPVFLLTAITCDRTQIIECLIFVGPREVIERKTRRMRSDLYKQMSQSGKDGFIFETTEPNCPIDWSDQERIE